MAQVDDEISDEAPVDEMIDASGGTATPEIGPGDILPYPVSPTLASDRINRITLRFPMPVACWRLQHAYFAFGSSFILPTVSRELRALAAAVRRDRLATIFGHADPVNDDEFNKRLSGRRARALYGLLTRNVDMWLDLFRPADGDNWGLTSTQQMLARLDRADGSGRFFTGPITGQHDQACDAAIRDFQRERGLAVDGDAGPVTRRALYGSYMDAICISPSRQLVMQPGDFLGDAQRNATGDGKAAYQGCGEFNPVVILSKADQRTLKKDERNSKNAVNRRVMVFFFRKSDFGPVDGAKLAEKWPCPAASETAQGCRKQFWANGDTRRAAGETERTYTVDRQTMACTWYDRLARLSPCEGGAEVGDVRIFLLDHFKQRMGNNPASLDPIEQELGAPYRLVLGPGLARVGYADKQGLLSENDVMITGVCTLQWGKQEDAEDVSPPEDEELARNYYLYSGKIYLNTSDGGGRTERQLSNLGYQGSDAECRADFAADYGSSDDRDIEDVHDTGRPRTVTG